MLTFRPALPADALPVVAHARHVDRVEWAGLGPSGISLSGMLVSAIEQADMVVTALQDGVPFCIFGVTPDPDYAHRGFPWLIATPVIEHHARYLIWSVRNIVHEWQQKYSYLANMVHRDNARTIRWLRMLGFTIEADPVYNLGRFGDPYLYFHRASKCVTPYPSPDSPSLP
jgi:hypothetical protein